MEEIESLVKKLQDSKKCTFANIADIINNCMSNKSKDVNMIEHYLDYLFDCIYDDNSLRYAYKVCDYLEKLDENQKEFIQVKTLEGLQKTTIDGYYKVFL